ncbi:MAG: hypothetical protein ACT4QC_12265 [Planctomycetaceae bacterium]
MSSEITYSIMGVRLDGTIAVISQHQTRDAAERAFRLVVPSPAWRRIYLALDGNELHRHPATNEA